MTAPTTRETADHAELAALVQDLRNSRTVWDNARARPKEIETRAADALENLLSEIAALRSALDVCNTARLHWQEVVVPALGDRATQAERQRDELREALVQADLTIRSMPGTDQSDVEFIRQALANQGADQ